MLGPILFLIYINDIVDSLNCNAYLFADAMKIYTGILDDTHIDKLQSDINSVSLWTDKWHLKLNAEKCQIMTVGRAYSRPAHTYNLPIGSGNQDLIRVSQEKDLEVLIDSDLNFDNHILSKVKTCNRIRSRQTKFQEHGFPGIFALVQVINQKSLRICSDCLEPFRVKTD